jgi:predicted RNA binding protein YcfA (HicA-like mRNA interferase family)
MGKRKYPPLKHREVRSILTALGFTEKRQAGTSHAQWERPADNEHARAIVTVGDYPEFDERLIKSMISQSTFDRQKFYGATPSTAKKIR